MGRDLEINEDLVFQRRSWRVQRAGWALMGVFMAAGVAGLLGGGPLSGVTEIREDLRVSYERYTRAASETVVRVEFVPRHDVSRISIGSRYVQDAGLERVWPEPVSMESVAGRTVIAIATPAPRAAAGAAPSASLLLRLRPGRPGSITTSLALDGGPPVRVRHLVLP